MKTSWTEIKLETQRQAKAVRKVMAHRTWISAERLDRLVGDGTATAMLDLGLMRCATDEERETLGVPSVSTAGAIGEMPLVMVKR